METSGRVEPVAREEGGTGVAEEEAEEEEVEEEVTGGKVISLLTEGLFKALPIIPAAFSDREAEEKEDLMAEVVVVVVVVDVVVEVEIELVVVVIVVVVVVVVVVMATNGGEADC